MPELTEAEDTLAAVRGAEGASEPREGLVAESSPHDSHLRRRRIPAARLHVPIFRA